MFDDSIYYDLAKVCEFTDLTLEKAKKLIKLRIFPRYRIIGGKNKFIVWKRDEIDQWMDG